MLWCDIRHNDSTTVIHRVELPISTTVTNTTPLDESQDAEPIDTFVDDSRIGVPSRNKVELSTYKLSKGYVSIVKFYSRGARDQWYFRNSFAFERNDLPTPRPQLEDFNNDGLNDFTYVSNIAARGANTVRTLFIYDKPRDELIHLRNSEDYPNLAYNKELDCVDAWAFHGATTTIFLKIAGDQLKEFASVNTGIERIVTLTDEAGDERVVRREKMSLDDIYTRYSRFDPPE
jgi:hypothetical protein